MNTSKTTLVKGSSDPLLTPSAAANRLGLKNSETLAVWRSTGRYDLPYVKVGRLVRYRASDIEAFIERNTFGGRKGS